MRPSFAWLAPMAAGFVAVLIGFASSAVIVYQAAIAMGASTEQFGSWIFSLALGMAVLSAGLSWRYRDPVVIAWSTPGAALLASALTQATLPEATGAFMFSAALMILVGATGWFERAMKRLPLSLASGLLAGILLRFGLDIFGSLQSQFGLVGGMLLVYLVGRRLAPRYVVILVLVAGVALAAMQGLLELDGFELALARPSFVMPAFSMSAIISIGIPLFVVTMASQNVPGSR
ncbi:MAG: benzoate/H(+) symporter BenE family transporter [Burkholderiaceae bacterium]